MDESNGYSICFNEWAMDTEIKGELGLLMIISSLTAEKGFCYASNEYLAKIFGIDETTVSRKIKKLEHRGYLKINYMMNGAQITAREIRIPRLESAVSKNVNGPLAKKSTAVSKIAKENITSINITSINNKKNIKKKEKCTPPTLEEVKEYVKKRNLNVDPEAFIKYFTANDDPELNWIDKNGEPVRNWKQKIITWDSYSHGKKKKEEDKMPVYDTTKNEEMSQEEVNELLALMKKEN